MRFLKSKKYIPCLIVLTISLMLLSCAAGVKGLVEPENENSVLIIGSAFLENNYYNEQFELYKDAIEVAVMGLGSQEALHLQSSTTE